MDGQAELTCVVGCTLAIDGLHAPYHLDTNQVGPGIDQPLHRASTL